MDKYCATCKHRGRCPLLAMPEKSRQGACGIYQYHLEYERHDQPTVTLCHAVSSDVAKELPDFLKSLLQ